MSIRDIENAITKLPRQKLAAFRAWFYKFDTQIWDNQFKEDAESGKLDNLAEQAIKDLKNNRCKEL